MRTGTKFQAELLEVFGKDELAFYLTMETASKCKYQSYFRNAIKYNTKHPLSPTHWLARNDSTARSDNFEGMSFGAIAQKLHMPYRQVMDAYKSAMQKLGVLLEEKWYER